MNNEFGLVRHAVLRHAAHHEHSMSLHGGEKDDRFGASDAAAALSSQRTAELKLFKHAWVESGLAQTEIAFVRFGSVIGEQQQHRRVEHVGPSYVKVRRLLKSNSCC